MCLNISTNYKHIVPTELKTAWRIVFYKHIVPTELKSKLPYLFFNLHTGLKIDRTKFFYKHIVPTELKYRTVQIVIPIQKGF